MTNLKIVDIANLARRMRISKHDPIIDELSHLPSGKALCLPAEYAKVSQLMALRMLTSKRTSRSLRTKRVDSGETYGWLEQEIKPKK